MKAWGRLLLSLGLVLTFTTQATAKNGKGPFRRIATFPVFLNTDVNEETVAEIVAAANQGNTLVYTDSENENIGFVDISDPANPQADGIVAVPGEPTSVGVAGNYALACINTSADFINTSGDLVVIDITTRQIVRTIALGGQPDAIAISPDNQYAAIAIENERDEDLGDGEPPQAPGGFVVIVDLDGAPANWSTRNVNLDGVSDLFPNDPEPEFVDINAENVAVVTLQENNYIVLIELSDGSILNDFSAGDVDLHNIDTSEDDLIAQNSSLYDVPREPDAVAWTSNTTFATADEGDLFGGSRGFTHWNAWGTTLYQAGSSMEHAVARLGHYPEGRSENKGNEPEGVEYGRYGHRRYLFVGSERSNLVFVYQFSGRSYPGYRRPRLVQILPTGSGPEGLLAIPERDLFVVANENDDRGDKLRSSIMIYKRNERSNYPTIESSNRRRSRLPIPWGALSGLVSHDENKNRLYTIHDSFYNKSRVYTLNVARKPAVITNELMVNDKNGVLQAALDNLKSNLPGTDDFSASNIVNSDGSVHLDPEGIELGANGSFYIASEGTGNLDNGISDPNNRPFERPNMIVHVMSNGTIADVIMPPLDVTKNQLRFGFKGVAKEGDYLYAAFQRAWGNAGDPSDRARIGRYDINSGEWTFAYYPLDAPNSPNGGWVGLSELTTLGDGKFAVLERDNQGGPDAAIKRVYTIEVTGIAFGASSEAPNFPVLTKTLVKDLVADDAYQHTGGTIPEKLEGLAATPVGDVWIVNDNDGVDDNSGETQLLRFDGLFASDDDD